MDLVRSWVLEVRYAMKVTCSGALSELLTDSHKG